MSATDRVLMTADTIGGVWTYAIELAAGLCARGARVVLAAMGEEASASQIEQARAIDGLHLEARPYALEWMEKPWDDIAEAADWLTGLAERHRPQVVHLNTLALGHLQWSAPVLTVGHSCVLSWFEAVKGQVAGSDWRHYREVVSRSLGASDMVVAPSATMLQALQRHYGPLEDTRVIYNGRDPRAFKPAEKQPIVLSAGRLWDEAKNVATIAEASSQIQWPVALAGSQQHPDGASVDFSGVHLLGRLDTDELAGWYGRSSIYALPARYEPFGLTALEAALAQNALVLGDIATLREIWSEAALFVDPDRPDQLADTINSLIEDGPRRRWLAKRAQQRARQLGAEAMVNRYVELYGELRGERATPSGRHYFRGRSPS